MKDKFKVYFSQDYIKV